jgi:hypothetical protein
MRFHVTIAIALLAGAACKGKEPVTAKLVDSRPGTSITGRPNLICVYRYTDVRGDHEVKDIRAVDAKCPSTIEVER